jgi:coenzyme F420-0:L-glutamate ligase/coenzyme F420-1:gamma-L-glutamate ligase
MSHVLHAIRERRSIRKYSDRPVPIGMIKEILATAGLAPSAHNAEPWRFIVLADSSIKRKLAEVMAISWVEDMEKDGYIIEPEKRSARIERFATASVLILACSTMDGMRTYSDERRQKIERDLAMQSLGAGLQNLLLAIHVKGLGACWFGAPAFCKEAVRTVLGIPDDVEPEALIAMGYPAEKPTMPPRKLLDKFCFKDKWGSSL